MNKLLENAISGAYDGSPKSYVALYNDFTEAKLDYKLLEGFQMALYKGVLVEHINQYIKDNWTRP